MVGTRVLRKEKDKVKDFELKLSNMLEYIDACGSNGFDDSKIEELEAIILECQSLTKKDYVNQVADSIYDTLYDMLKQVKPDSGILSEIWEDDGDITDYTELLVKNPMMSIETAKSYECKEIVDWINSMPEEDESYFASFKINGHGIRVVYKDGYLVSATSRARASAGRDLTRHMKILLGEYNDALKDYGMVELRGEVCLKLENLDKAREFNPEIKSAFSAVASLIRPSATEEEIELLDFLCYGFIVDGFTFNDREEEFMEIESVGYETPQYLLIESSNRYDLLETIKSTIEAFEEAYEEFGYFCDGVVFEINSRELFNSMGIEGNHNCGNIALKVGLWKQDQYVGYVQKIIWTKGKSKLSPVALVAEEPYTIPDDERDIDGIENHYWDDLGVLTAQGNKVRRVPLYEPKNILILDAYVGCPVYFRYGGEAGVVPCFSDGRLLKEDVVRDILVGESAPWDYEE